MFFAAGFSKALALLGLLGVMASPVSAAAAPLEAKVKAAYLYHLIKFVDWPNLPADSFRICVHGSDEVGSLLGELSNRSARERPLIIEREGDAARCQMLFIGRDEKNPAELLARVRKVGILTVGDQEDFARRGGIVGFYSDAGKIKLEVNPEAARNANLKISAKLLELARPVSGGRE